MYKLEWFTALLSLILFGFVAPTVFAQDGQLGIPTLRSVAEARSIPVYAGGTQTYRIEGCNPANALEPCYGIVTATYAPSGPDTFGPLVDHSAQITCTFQVLNSLYQEVGRLVENVGVTFHGTGDKAPVTLNYGNLSGTVAYGPLNTWLSTSGPLPNPSWGTRANSQAFATSSGMFQYGIPTGGETIVFTQINVGITLRIDTSGWACF